jgi:hypothetical protein
MNILNFNKFLNEINESRVNLPILDIVIDEDGTPYNGEESDRIIKGVVERTKGVITRILGRSDNKEYPAGIDKNGNVVSIEFDDEGRALDFSGNPIKVPTWVQKKYKLPEYYYVNPEFDYYSLIPIIPTGWVNVKIDMEVVKRVRRYAKTLGTNTKGHLSFIDKLTEFQKFSTQNRTEGGIKRLKRGTIQKEMSCILLLHYINEIKDFFNPSQGGFLFESFIGGLIPNARIKEDNSPVDIRTTTGDRYQLKLIDWNTEYVDVTIDDDGGRYPYLEWYMIALKYVDKIEILIINGSKLAEMVKSDVTAGGLLTKGGAKSGPKFKIKGLLTLNDDNFLNKFTIDLSNIESRIKNLGEGLKKNLDELYNELSEFQYNVETIVTGINEKGQVIRDQSGFDVYHIKSEENIKKLANHLKNLVSDINK